MKLAYKTMVACAFLGIVAGPLGAAGDEVKMLKGSSYSGVRVTDVKDGMVIFSMNNGRRIEKDLTEVKQITIADKASFNKAEKLMADGKAAEAVTAYDECVKGVSENWMLELIRYRRFEALKQAPLVTRAIKEWITIAEGSKYSKKSLSMKPTQLAKAGSTDNARAIKVLESAIDKHPAKATKEYILALKQLLLDLYQLEGHKEKAAKLALELTGTTPSTKPENGDEKTTPATTTNTSAQLKGVEVLLSQGKADKVLEVIEDNLRLYSDEELPLALLLRGKAKTILAEGKTGEEAQQMLLSGGLDFMRIFVYYPSSDEAAEALYLVGVMHTMLENPNPRAAGKAFRKVISDYSSSEFVDKAKAALKKINQ